MSQDSTVNVKQASIKNIEQLQSCEDWPINYLCFYETLNNLSPEEGLQLCSNIIEERHRSACARVLVNTYPDILENALQLCKNSAPICTINLLEAYGNNEKCEMIEYIFADKLPQTINTWKTDCVRNSKLAESDSVIFQAINNKDALICEKLSPLVMNVCISEVAKRTGNINLCGQITPSEEEDFPFSEYCKCAVEQSEPYVFCLDSGNPFDEKYEAKCIVKNGSVIVDKINSSSADESREIEARFAPKRTEWKYSKTREMYKSVLHLSMFYDWESC